MQNCCVGLIGFLVTLQSNPSSCYSPVFHDYTLDYSSAPSSVVSRITGHLMRSTSLLSDHVEEADLPVPVQHWLDQFSSWCNDWKIKSLDVLLARCTMYIILYKCIFRLLLVDVIQVIYVMLKT